MNIFSIFLGVALLCSTAVAGDWPQFRGPQGQGHAEAADPPTRWSETKNIAWKTAIHGRGWSSPVVFDKQIWMTTAEPDGSRMYVLCVDRDSGKITHDVTLFRDVVVTQEINVLNSFASPTPVVEQGRVYVNFGTYGTACLDTATAKPVWVRRDIHCDHYRGPGSSPILFGDLLIFNMDGIDVQYVIALDKKTGETVWKSPRTTDFGKLVGDLRKAYSTPLVIEAAGRKQLINPGAQAVISYDPTTGKDLWTVRYPGGFSNVSRPVFDGKFVFVTTGFGKSSLFAIRPDGHGDVTDSHVAWRIDKSVVMKPSPVLVNGLLYMASDKGILTCSEASDGKPVWKERLGGVFSASPVVAGGRIYFCDHDGKTIVIEPGRRYKSLATNTLDSGCMASPAVVGKALFLRTKTHLYRVE